MEKKNQRRGDQVDLLYLLKVLKTHLLIIVAAAVLCGGFLGVFRFLTAEPMYTSKVSFFVNGVATNSNGEMFVTGSSASTAQLLTEAFAKIVKQNRVLEEVSQQVKKNSGRDVSAEEISSMLGVTYEAQLVYVSVKTDDPDQSYEVAKAIEEVVPDWFNYLLNLGNSKGDTDQGVKPVEVLFFANGVNKESATVNGSNYVLSKVLADILGTMMQQEDMQIKVQQQLEENGGPTLSAEAVASAVRVDGGDGAIYVSVSHTDPDVAELILDSVSRIVMNWFDASAVAGGEDGAEIQEDDQAQEDSVNDVYLVKPTNSADRDTVTKSGRDEVIFALVGAIFGAAIVYLAFYIKTVQDNTIYNTENIRSHFSLPVVGQIPGWEDAESVGGKKQRSRKAKKRRARALRRGETGERVYKGRLLNEQTPFAVSEAFKALRTNMCYTSKGQDSVVYGVTSAYVGAGKSLVSANTAIAFAQMGKRVLLIDGDMRCPVQHKIFGVSRKAQGLSELLAGVQKDRNQVICSTEVEGLDVIVGGHEPPNPAELLASDNMKDLIRYARENYDVVFVDLPPVGMVTDAGVIGNLVTGYVLVVRASYSDRREVQSSLDTMEALGAPMIGFVLNDVDLKGTMYHNRYYKSYSHYIHRESDNEQAPEA